MKCTSGEKAGGGRETHVGNFKQFCWSFVLCLRVSPSLRQGLLKQPARPGGLKSESPATHSLGMFGSWGTIMATLFRWSPCLAVQGQVAQEWCGMGGKLSVLYPALSPYYKEESYDALWIYTSLLYTTCKVNLSFHSSSVIILHDTKNRVNSQIFSLNNQNIQYSNVRYSNKNSRWS